MKINSYNYTAHRCYRSTDHLSSISFRYSALSTDQTTCSCRSDSATLTWQVFSLSSSCAGACFMSRYPTDVCCGFMVLACWLNEDWEDRGIVKNMCIPWTFMADGHSSIEQENQLAVLSSVNGHSSITLFVTSSLHLECILIVQWTPWYHHINLLWVDLFAMM